MHMVRLLDVVESSSYNSKVFASYCVGALKYAIGNRLFLSILLEKEIPFVFLKYLNISDC